MRRDIFVDCLNSKHTFLKCFCSTKLPRIFCFVALLLFFTCKNEKNDDDDDDDDDDDETHPPKNPIWSGGAPGDFRDLLAGDGLKN